MRRVDATDFDFMLSSNGAGAFGQVEYNDRNDLVLRTTEVRTNDVSGAVRVYFNSQRDQVVSGLRFDVMGSGLVLMRPGIFYRVQTQLEIIEPIPAGVTAKIVVHPSIADVLMITSPELHDGFLGQVCFTVLPYRKVEVERMTSLASLVFFEDTGVKNTKNSTRTKIEEQLEPLGAVISAKKTSKASL